MLTTIPYPAFVIAYYCCIISLSPIYRINKIKCIHSLLQHTTQAWTQLREKVRFIGATLKVYIIICMGIVYLLQ